MDLIKGILITIANILINYYNGKMECLSCRVWQAWVFKKIVCERIHLIICNCSRKRLLSRIKVQVLITFISVDTQKN